MHKIEPYRQLLNGSGKTKAGIILLVIVVIVVYAVAEITASAGDFMNFINHPFFQPAFSLILFFIFLWLGKKALDEAIQNDEKKNSKFEKKLNELLISRDQEFFSQTIREIHVIKEKMGNCYELNRKADLLYRLIKLMKIEEHAKENVIRILSQLSDEDTIDKARHELRDWNEDIREVKRAILIIDPDYKIPDLKVSEYDIKDFKNKNHIAKRHQDKFAEFILQRDRWYKSTTGYIEKLHKDIIKNPFGNLE